MKLHYLIAIVVASIGAALPAAASSTFHATNDEPGSLNHVVPGTLTRAQRHELNRIESQVEDPLWAFTSEEGGWELRPHTYDFRDGRLRHTDAFAHDRPRPTDASDTDNPIYRYLERG